MNLAFSNIAWNRTEDPEILDLLTELNVGSLEIAPTRLWDNPADVTREEVEASVESLRQRGFSIASFQALLFGKPELTLFESEEIRSQTLAYLKKIVNLAEWCGATRLVFGSPKNRSRKCLSMADANKIGAEFFSNLGEYAAAHGCQIVIEPNPVAYGCDYIQNVEDAVELVAQTASPGFGLHLDSGELNMNDESLAHVFASFCPLIRHVHLSEPMLEPLGSNPLGHQFHIRLASVLAASKYTGSVAIEMKRCEPVAARIREAVQFVRKIYSTIL